MKVKYAVDSEGLTYSRVGKEVAVPVKTQRNKFGTFNYKLLKFNLNGLGADELNSLEWTDKLPKSVKEYHLKFWRKEKQ